MYRVFQTSFFANTCGSGYAEVLNGENRAKCGTTGSPIVHNDLKLSGILHSLVDTFLKHFLALWEFSQKSSQLLLRRYEGC